MVEGGTPMGYKVPLGEQLKRIYRKYRRPFAYAAAVMITAFLLWLAVVTMLLRCQ